MRSKTSRWEKAQGWAAKGEGGLGASVYFFVGGGVSVVVSFVGEFVGGRRPRGGRQKEGGGLGVCLWEVWMVGGLCRGEGPSIIYTYTHIYAPPLPVSEEHEEEALRRAACCSRARSRSIACFGGVCGGVIWCVDFFKLYIRTYATNQTHTHIHIFINKPTSPCSAHARTCCTQLA